MHSLTSPHLNSHHVTLPAEEEEEEEEEDEKSKPTKQKCKNKCRLEGATSGPKKPLDAASRTGMGTELGARVHAPTSGTNVGMTVREYASKVILPSCV